MVRKEYDPRTLRKIGSAAGPNVVYYQGSLRDYLSAIFWVMATGLAITAAVATYASSTGLLTELFHLNQVVSSDGQVKTAFSATPLWWVVTIAEFVLLFMVAASGNAKAPLALFLFFAFSALNGLTLAPVLVAYTSESVIRVFFIAASMFGAAALWGHTTKYDMTGLGLPLFLALFGLLIVMIIGIFVQSTMLDMMIGVAGVVLFVIITAYDIQKYEQWYNAAGGQYTGGMIAIGAMDFYLDFVNIFLFLLRLFGDRK